MDLPSWETVRTYMVSFFLPQATPVADLAEPSPQARALAPRETPAPAVLATPQPPLSLAQVGGSHVLAAPAAIPMAEDVQPVPFHPAIAYRVITYTYDPLYRLTNASYNDGSYFTYTYDATGNRLTEVTVSGTTTYVYDNANRLTTAGGVTHTWDNNGNLLSDGTSTYTYDKANRLKTVVQGGTTYGYVYNGLGDRLRQTVNSTPTTYALDMAGGLTQVLSDGTNTYLYGLGRIGEEQPGGWLYHLGDALGSVRQLVDSSGAITMAKAYAPFGNSYYSHGTGTTAFQFVGEQRDATGLVFLRARYMSISRGRFISADTWGGDPLQPLSGNLWAYAYDNPINRTDPSGRRPCGPGCDGGPDENPEFLYGIRIDSDWPAIHRGELIAAVQDVAGSLARAYNNVYLKWLWSAYDEYRACDIDSMKYLAPDIFRAAYHSSVGNPIEFLWDKKCKMCREDWKQCADKEYERAHKDECASAGGYTHGPHKIEFASLSEPISPNRTPGMAFMSARNNIVHELGHAFADRFYSNGPKDVLGQSDYRNLLEPGGFHPSPVSAGRTWRQSRETTQSEIFADMFLGWTYNKWENSDLGQDRSDFMWGGMPFWIARALSM